ncbi:craniofacial development protein 2-like [Palaemon carinicauda]|uniref:craniofacial development protein 2-like n=1 Tax=Palaemon carinicauda TaxID=392227 RepID=UPI0035B69F28
MMTPRAEKALSEWRAVNSKLILANLKSRQCNMSIIVCYAPTNDSPEEKKEEYYEEIRSVIDEIPERDMKIVIGDFNAKVGRNNQGIENVMGVEVVGEVASENGAPFISFCSTNNLVIGGTLSSTRASTNIRGRHHVVSKIKACYITSKNASTKLSIRKYSLMNIEVGIFNVF